MDTQPAEDEVRRDRQAMANALSQGNMLLWDRPLGWDVLVLCRQVSWRVHRSVLRQCPYFTERMVPWGIIPDEPQENGSDTTRVHGRVRHYLLVLGGHHPSHMSNVLWFLYFQDCPGTAPNLRRPLHSGCLLTSAALFIAAASVACQPMMDYLSVAIFRYAALVRAHLTPAVIRDSPYIDSEVLRLAVPLRIALTLLYEQPPDVLDRVGEDEEERGRTRTRARARTRAQRQRSQEQDRTCRDGYGILWPLRQMLVRFTADVLPRLACNPAFQAQFRTEWEGSVFLPQLEADLAVQSRETQAERGERSIARAETALLLLHALTRAEQAFIAAVLRRQGLTEESTEYEEEGENQDEDHYEPETENQDENRDADQDKESGLHADEQRRVYPEEEEVERIEEQLNNLGLE